jgi:hypothetical protein
MAENRPNILFIFSDRHRFCDVGYRGNADVCTPNLDRLGENLSFEFLKQSMVKVPFLGGKVRAFEAALDRLND